MKRGGFTLLEVLLVVVLLGILAAAVAPAVGGMLSGGALRTGARELAAVGRYAHSMALLNQTPVDLVVDLDSGAVRVVARERESASRFGLSDLAAYTNDVGYTDELLQTSARRNANLAGGFGLAMSAQDRESRLHEAGDAGTNTLAIVSDAAGRELPAEVSFADSVNIERTLEGVSVSFEGFRDTVRDNRRGSDDDPGAALSGEVVVHYRANGTVRPHRWRVREKDAEDAAGGWLDVSVSAVGTPRVLSPEDRE